MSILKINSSINLTRRILKNNSIKSKTFELYRKSKSSLMIINKQVSEKSKNISPPIKYYLIGLAIPLPFASTVGLIYGTGILLKEKLSKYTKKVWTS